MKLKNIDKFKKYIKLIIGYPQYHKIFKLLKINQNNRCVLIGTPIHGNLGDSLIAQQCIKYLENNYNYVIEIPEFVYEIFSNKIKINIDDDIYICGGGWMGNIYEDELVIEDIIKNYSDNKKIILPQTISFSPNGKYSSKNNLRSILSNDKKTIICVREENSYNLCLNDLKINPDNCLLLPDMALLALDNIKNGPHDKNRIIFSIRNDIEKCSSDIDLNNIKLYLNNKNYECFDSSTVISKKVIKIKYRNKYIQKKIEEYSNADIVITDRLHSMVFALLAGCKCIAIDNTTHKVSGVYKKWLYTINGLWVLENSSKLSDHILDKCLECQHYPSKIIFKNIFLELDRRINEL